MNTQEAQQLDKKNRRGVLDHLSVEALREILKGYGIEVPITDGSGSRKEYKETLVRIILACEYGA